MFNKNNKNALFYFIVGSFLGTLLGILYAPNDGNESRQTIKKLLVKLFKKTTCSDDSINEQNNKVIHSKNNKIFCQQNDVENKKNNQE
jgi:gas vesicle protein